MSKNNKSARLRKLAADLPKNRSAAARAKRAAGETRQPGRATAPNHGKRKAWWQMFKSYSDFIQGGGKKAPRQEKMEVEQDATA